MPRATNHSIKYWAGGGSSNIFYLSLKSPEEILDVVQVDDSGDLRRMGSDQLPLIKQYLQIKHRKVILNFSSLKDILNYVAKHWWQFVLQSYCNCSIYLGNNDECIIFFYVFNFLKIFLKFHLHHKSASHSNRKATIENNNFLS